MEEDEDIFAFRHALTADAVAAGLLSRERRALHARVVDTLETLRRDDEGSLDRLAYHSYAAGDWPRAFDYLTRAGRRAMGLYAPSVALDDINRAIYREAQRSNQKPEKIAKDLEKDRERVAMLQQNILVDKALDFLVAKASVSSN